jgi:hypothetical protein
VLRDEDDEIERTTDQENIREARRGAIWPERTAPGSNVDDAPPTSQTVVDREPLTLRDLALGGGNSPRERNTSTRAGSEKEPEVEVRVDVELSLLAGFPVPHNPATDATTPHGTGRRVVSELNAGGNGDSQTSGGGARVRVLKTPDVSVIRADTDVTRRESSGSDVLPFFRYRPGSILVEETPVVDRAKKESSPDDGSASPAGDVWPWRYEPGSVLVEATPGPNPAPVRSTPFSQDILSPPPLTCDDEHGQIGSAESSVPQHDPQQRLSFGAASQDLPSSSQSIDVLTQPPESSGESVGWDDDDDIESVEDIDEESQESSCTLATGVSANGTQREFVSSYIRRNARSYQNSDLSSTDEDIEDDSSPAVATPLLQAVSRRPQTVICDQSAESLLLESSEDWPSPPAEEEAVAEAAFGLSTVSLRSSVLAVPDISAGPPREVLFTRLVPSLRPRVPAREHSESNEADSISLRASSIDEDSFDRSNIRAVHDGYRIWRATASVLDDDSNVHANADIVNFLAEWLRRAQDDPETSEHARAAVRSAISIVEKCAWKIGRCCPLAVPCCCVVVLTHSRS